MILGSGGIVNWRKFTTSCVTSASLWNLSHCLLHSSSTPAQEAPLMAGATKMTQLLLSPVPRKCYFSNLATRIYHSFTPHSSLVAETLFQASAVEMSGAPFPRAAALLKKHNSRQGSLKTFCPKPDFRTKIPHH